MDYDAVTKLSTQSTVQLLIPRRFRRTDGPTDRTEII